MNYLLSVTLFVLAGNCFSQTRVIHHKSHSGKSKNFISTGFTSNSNFGMSPQRIVRNSKLDSLILIDEKTVIMVTSETCHMEEFDRSDKSTTHIWKAGRDTVYQHDLFNGKNSVEDIRETVRKRYFFANPAESIVFIGFEADKQGKQPTFPTQATTENSKKVKKKKTIQEPIEKTRPSYITLILMSIISILTRGTLMPH